ncbi:hypothetical protein Btru_027957 [Bulinus truncatus]|nr:hypothetical protein Btru_027957 [Bulinus truncatus]
MDRISSQREKGRALDYLSEFQIASNTFMSSQNPIEQVFQTFGHHAPISTASPMNFQPAQQTTFGHPAGQQYSGAHSYNMSMAERYPPVSAFTPPYGSEDYFPPHCQLPPGHPHNQSYAGTLLSTTPPVPQPMQQHSPQLSPMLRTQHQSPQHSPGAMTLHSKIPSAARAAPVKSPQTSVYVSQLHNPQQPYSSTVSSANYYQTNQCSQRNDPPVGNMHMAKINSGNFNQTSHYSSPAHLLQSTQHRNLQSSTDRIGSKEDSSGAQRKNQSPNISRLLAREPNPSSIHQTNNYISPLAHVPQSRPSAAGSNSMPGRFHVGMSMAPVRPPSSVSLTSMVYRKPNPSIARPPAVSGSSKVSSAAAFGVNPNRNAYAGINQSMVRDKQVVSATGAFDRSISSVSALDANPYSVFSIFSINGQPPREGSRGRAEMLAARGRGRTVHSDVTRPVMSDETNPVNWYKSPESHSTSSYSSDIEAMQADIILDSYMPTKALKQTARNDSPCSTQNPAQKSSAPSSSSAGNKAPDSGQSSACASKAAALAAIQIKQELVENLSKNRSSKSATESGEPPIAMNKTPAKLSSGSSPKPTPTSSISSSVTKPVQPISKDFLNNKYPDNQANNSVKSNVPKSNQINENLSLGQDKSEKNSSTSADSINKNKDSTIILNVNERDNRRIENFLDFQPKSQNLPAKKSFVINDYSCKPVQPKVALHTSNGSLPEKRPLSSREKVFDMWKAGQVVGRAPGKGRGRCAESPAVTQANVPGPKSSADRARKAGQPQSEGNGNCLAPKIREMGNQPAIDLNSEVTTPLGIKAKESPQDLRYVMLHGHKLICLKPQNEALVLLCQFQFECFPDKGKGSLNNCIDRALRIKKRILDHSMKSSILSFLQKNEYPVQMVQTISLDDARRVYHYMYKITSCSNDTCVVELSNQPVDLEAVSLPTKHPTSKAHALRVKKEKTSSEDNAYGTMPSGKLAGEKSDSLASSARALLNNDEVESQEVEKEADNQSFGSDHTELYGRTKELDDDLIFVGAIEDPNFISCPPGTPETGGIFNSVVGQVRYYHHDKQNYLVVEDLCRIFSASAFMDSIEKDDIVMYSCSENIAAFLNKISSKFPPLTSTQQSLIKETDIGAHITDETSCAGVSGEDMGSLKRPICKQEPDDYEPSSSPKKRKIDKPPLSTESETDVSDYPSCNTDSPGADRENFSMVDVISSETASHQLASQSAEVLPNSSLVSDNFLDLPEGKTQKQKMTPEKESEPDLTESVEENNTESFVSSSSNNLETANEKTHECPTSDDTNSAQESGQKDLPLDKTNNLRISALKLRSMLLKTKKSGLSSADVQVPDDSTTLPEERLKEQRTSDNPVEQLVSCEAQGSVASSETADDQCKTADADSESQGSLVGCVDLSQAGSAEPVQTGRTDPAQADKEVLKEITPASGSRVMARSQSASSSICVTEKKIALDDLHIITSLRSGFLAVPPRSQHHSTQFLSEGYDKLCYQNKALLQIVQIMRKELASVKEKAETEAQAHREIVQEMRKEAALKEKEVAEVKEKAEIDLQAQRDVVQELQKELAAVKDKAKEETQAFKNVINQLTSTFKNYDEESPILIDDDYVCGHTRGKKVGSLGLRVCPRLSGAHGLRGGAFRRHDFAPKKLQEEKLEVVAELLAGGPVDEDVAGVVGDAQLHNDLPDGEVGQVAVPHGVLGHGLQAHVVAELDYGLHGVDDGHRQLAEDQVEADPHERGRRGGAAGPDVPVQGLAGDVQLPDRPDLTEDANVQDEGHDGDDAEHDQLGRPVPDDVDPVEGRAVGGPDRALADLRADVPEDGLGEGQAERDAQDGGDDLGGPGRLGELLAGERPADGDEALNGEGEHQEEGDVL